jgi:hypothetical protein
VPLFAYNHRMQCPRCDYQLSKTELLRESAAAQGRRGRGTAKSRDPAKMREAGRRIFRIVLGCSFSFRCKADQLLRVCDPVPSEAKVYLDSTVQQHIAFLWLTQHRISVQFARSPE